MQTTHLQRETTINPWELGFKFAIGFQKKGQFGLDPGSTNADDFRPDVIQFSLEKVVTDPKGISTVFNVTDITLTNC